MYKTTTKHISRGPHPQSMPRVRLLIFLHTCPTIVSLGAKRYSRFPGTGLPVEVKRTVILFDLLFRVVERGHIVLFE